MLIKNDEKIKGALFTAILPLLLFFMAYYGFESSYVRWKHLEKAPDFIFQSVYAYRIIPNFLTVHTAAFLTEFINTYLSAAKPFLLKNGSIFYHSFFLVNVVFFMGSSFVLDKILKFSPNLFASDQRVKTILHLTGVFIMVMVQYVPTNCDSIAVFFFLSGIFFSLKFAKLRRRKDFIILCLTVFVSTFVRETSCLNLAFFAAFLFDFNNFKIKNSAFYREIFILILTFTVPYFGLRIMIPQDSSLAEGVYLKNNFTSPFNIAGLVFGIIFLYFFYTLCGTVEKNIFKKFLLFSLPYSGMITFVGLFWETRLFLPLILAGLVVASQDFNTVQKAS